MEATNFGVGIATIEAGQTTPLHASAAEHAIYLVEGEVEWTIEGQGLALRPGDMLFIPADAKYVYTNIGRTCAAFVSVISRVSDWPHEDTYYE
jgi:quercetin dioxygenase-like cupin family protein